MKILHVLNSDRFSGAENVVCQIIEMFKSDTNIEMVYCSPDGSIRDMLKEREIVFAPVSKMTKKELKRVIIEQKPDIIHAHDMRASFVAARSCGKITLISHIHNNNFDSRGISAKSIAFLYAAKKSEHIFWVSKSSYEGYVFHGFFKKKSSVLYNVINIEVLYEKMRQDEKKYDYDVIYVGRLTYPKNPQRLMNVFRLVVEKIPNVKIAVVGTGDLENDAKKLADSYGLLDNVHFLGFQSNPLKILHDSKVMVMASRWEGTPMCALETMALGVPIVSTPVDGLKDLIVNDENGFLSDEDEVMADKIISYINTPTKRKEMSDKQMFFAKEWNDINKYKQKLFNVYREIKK
ncbi:MAG: glycosyltransferase [Candidatus Borkfalkiaceae bacterium]|nr:glycosyltransferase [Clostridia bacterium]MDY6222695.1 glycosyltransferase [Christensenellaceae bacterium]